MPSYTSISKPSTTYSQIDTVGMELLQEDGFALLQEDSSYIFVQNSIDFTSISNPTTTYSNINKPS